MNKLGGKGLWDSETGFYYDQLRTKLGSQKLKIRSLVGVVPFFAVGSIPSKFLDKFPGFAKRTRWFLKYRGEVCFLRFQAFRYLLRKLFSFLLINFSFVDCK